MRSYIILTILITLIKIIKTLDDDPYIITVEEIPLSDSRVMPYVGNGHLATTVYSDTIYINGVYNGNYGNSHRARVPNLHGLYIKPSHYEENFLNKNYSMDFGSGEYINFSLNYEKLLKLNH